MEGGNICFFPEGREGGGVVDMIKEVGEERQAYRACTF